jgi:uncharacterized protein (DUF1684 family)
MKYIAIFLSLLFLSACQQKSDEFQSVQNEQKVLREYRAEKDSLFRTTDWSPIKEQERDSFSGLNYFPQNDEFRFSGPIHLYNNPKPTRIYATKSGDVRPARTLGYFSFEYNGAEYRLEIFRMYSKKDTTQSFLFLGFTDATTGNETYGAGRYIDLDENSENYYTVDFNYAYNPYCAYNERYSCALPPAANRLPFEVTAGEKVYREH